MNNEDPGESEVPEPQRSETVFQGVKFAVERRRIPARDGGTAIREVVVHPGAVVVLPILADGRIVMIRNRRFAVDETLWELCAGTLEPNEAPVVTAGRELIEETGFEAGRIEPLTVFYTSPGICTERMYAYVATELEGVGQRLEDTEEIEVVALPWDTVLGMMESGEIRDGKTIATLLYHGAFRAIR